jgi:hypothetical protein
MKAGETKVGYLYNMRESRHFMTDEGREVAGLLLYLIAKDGSTFRATHLHMPYFFVRGKFKVLIVCIIC